MSSVSQIISELAIRISADSSAAKRELDDFSSKIRDLEKTFSAPLVSTGSGGSLSSMLGMGGPAPKLPEFGDYFSRVTDGVYAFNSAFQAGNAILGQYSQTVGMVEAGIDLFTGPLRKAAESANQDFAAMREGIAEFVSAVKEGGEFNEVGTSYENLATRFGINSDRLISRISNVTDNMITFQDIMKSSANAIRSGIDDDQIVSIYNFANRISEMTDRFGTARQVAESMTQAIISGNSRMLKQFDLVVEDGAKVSDVIAQINDRLQEFGDSPFNMGEKIDSVFVQVTNLEDAFKRGLNQSFEGTGIAEVLDDVTSGLQDLVPYAEKAGLMFTPIAVGIGEFVRVGSEQIKVFYDIGAGLLSIIGIEDPFIGTMKLSADAMYGAASAAGTLYNIFSFLPRKIGEAGASVGVFAASSAGWDDWAMKFDRVATGFQNMEFDTGKLLTSQTKLHTEMDKGLVSVTTNIEHTDRAFKRSTESAEEMKQKIGKIEEDLADKIQKVNDDTQATILKIDHKRLQAKEDLSEKLHKIEADRIEKISKAEEAFSEKIAISDRKFSDDRIKAADDTDRKLSELSSRFAQEQEKAEADHGRQMATMSSEHEASLSKIAVDAHKERETASNDFHRAMAQEEMAFSKNIADAQRDSERQIETLETDHQKKRSQIFEDGQRKIADLNASYQEKILNINNSFQDKMTSAQEKLNDRLAALEQEQLAGGSAEKIAAERLKAEADYQREVAKIQSESQKDRQKAEAAHAQEMTKAQQDMNQKLISSDQEFSDKKKDLQSKLLDVLQKLQNDHDSNSAKANQDYQAKIQQSLENQKAKELETQNNFNKQVSDASAEYSRRMSEMQQKFGEERSKIVEDSNRKQAELERKHSDEIEKLKKDLAEKVSEIGKKSHEDSYEAEKAYQKKLAELNEQQAEAVQKAQAKQKDIDKEADKKIQAVLKKYTEDFDYSLNDLLKDQNQITQKAAQDKQRVTQALNQTVGNLQQQAKSLTPAEALAQQRTTSGSGPGGMNFTFTFQMTGDPVIDLILEKLNKAARMEGTPRAGS